MLIPDIIAYLESALTLPVYAEVPANPPKKFVIVEQTSGGRTNLINDATVAVQSYANSLLDAMTLNDAVKDAMYDIITLDSITACRLNSDYNYTDTAQKKYRYQAVFNITYY